MGSLRLKKQKGRPEGRPLVQNRDVIAYSLQES
jgi:hypothetical protein